MTEASETPPDLRTAHTIARIAGQLVTGSIKNHLGADAEFLLIISPRPGLVAISGQAVTEDRLLLLLEDGREAILARQLTHEFERATAAEAGGSERS